MVDDGVGIESVMGVVLLTGIGSVLGSGIGFPESVGREEGSGVTVAGTGECVPPSPTVIKYRTIIHSCIQTELRNA